MTEQPIAEQATLAHLFAELVLIEELHDLDVELKSFGRDVMLASNTGPILIQKMKESL